ncbi:hypothetical protein LCGC14_2124160, partial [marine sediment metagenome]
YERYTFETADIGSSEITQIRVRIRAFYLGAGTPQVNLYFDGAYQGWKNLISDFNNAHDYNWTGLNGDQTDLDGLQVRFKSSLSGMVRINTIWALEAYASYGPSIGFGIIRPSGDVTTQWLPSAVPHWSRLDEDVVDPEPGDSSFIIAASYDNGDIDDFFMDNNVQFVREVTEIQVKTLGIFVGTLRPRVSIYWNGVWQSWETVYLPGSLYPFPAPDMGWATNTWTLEGDQKDVDNLRVRYKARVQNVPYASNLINAFYSNILYEPGISICSPKEGGKYSEYVYLDIEPAYLEDLNYVLDNGDPIDILGDIAIHIPEGSHTIKVSGTYNGIDYESERSFFTYQVSNTRQVMDWGVDAIDAERLWGFVDGTGVNVLVIDTGIDYNHIDLDGNYKGGYDFIGRDEFPLDTDGHGTMTSGLIGAENNGDGVIGVAPNVNLYAARTGGYRGYLFNEALEWAASSGSPNFGVISMSLGEPIEDFEEKYNLRILYEGGTVLVAAAGNWDNNPYSVKPTNYTGINYPAGYYEYVIPVGALNLNLTIADNWYAGEVGGVVFNGGSCFGFEDNEGIVAPGTQITSTSITNSYGILNGTSFAAPLVAGISALLLDIKPDLNPSEVKDILYTTAIDLGDAGWDSIYGWGLVDAVAAVEYAIINY